MKHTYKISGMTCGNCRAKVHQLLSSVAGVKNVDISLQKGEATIEMERHINMGELQSALKDDPKYQLSELNGHAHAMIDNLQTTGEQSMMQEEKVSWLRTYKPILLVFAFIFGVTLLVEAADGNFVWMRWMNHFMAGFFLVFSFFKLLDLRAFAESYATYDIVAKNWMAWGYIYAFIELMLGIAFLTGLSPVITNAVTFAVMAVSIVGVLQSVMNKRKIRCACLGAVFSLPMSTITIIEDALMMAMSLTMLIAMILA